MASKDEREERRVLTIVWKIENILLAEADDGWTGVTSPVFRARSLERRKLRLALFPNWTVDGTNKCLKLDLGLFDDPLGFPIDCEWSLVGRKNSIPGGAVQNIKLKSNSFAHLSVCPSQEEVFGIRKSEFLPHNTLTVRCRIWKFGNNLSGNEYISCRTHYENLEHSFHWPISGFSALALNREVISPVAFGDCGMTDNFLISFALTGASLEDSNAMVKLVPVSMSISSRVTLKLSILDKDQKVVKCMDSQSIYFKMGSKKTWLFQRFTSRKELLEKESDCLVNDVLTLYCEMPSISITRIVDKNYFSISELALNTPSASSTLLDFNSNCPSLEESEQRHSLAILVRDLQTLYKDRIGADFKLCSGDVTFPVHKNILSVRSPILKDAFEKESGTLQVPDFDSHTLDLMLTFLYTGMLDADLQWESVVKLFYAAEHFKVESLKRRCSFAIRCGISVSNVPDILTLADSHTDIEMMTFANDFILSRFDEVMTSEEWHKFMNTDAYLAGSTMHLLYQKKLRMKQE